MTASAPIVTIGHTDVAGARIANTITCDSQALTLNGAGLRSLVLLRVYVAALYTPRPLRHAAEVLDSTEPRAIELVLARTVEAGMVLGSFYDAIKLNATATEMQALSPYLNRLDPAIRAVGRIREGDRLRLEFSGDGVTRVLFNGDLRETIDSPALARALLGMWLGRRPVQDSLKKALLGGR